MRLVEGAKSRYNIKNNKDLIKLIAGQENTHLPFCCQPYNRQDRKWPLAKKTIPAGPSRAVLSSRIRTESLRICSQITVADPRLEHNKKNPATFSYLEEIVLCFSNLKRDETRRATLRRTEVA